MFHSLLVRHVELICCVDQVRQKGDGSEGLVSARCAQHVSDSRYGLLSFTNISSFDVPLKHGCYMP